MYIHVENNGKSVARSMGNHAKTTLGPIIKVFGGKIKKVVHGYGMSVLRFKRKEVESAPKFSFKFFGDKSKELVNRNGESVLLI